MAQMDLPNLSLQASVLDQGLASFCKSISYSTSGGGTYVQVVEMYFFVVGQDTDLAALR